MVHSENGRHLGSQFATAGNLRSGSGLSIGRSLEGSCGRECSLFDAGRVGGDGGEISSVERDEVQRL